MELLKQRGGYVWIAEAPNYLGDGNSGSLNIGVSKSSVDKKFTRGNRWMLGQWYGIAQPELVSTRRIYKGLKREMYLDHNPDAAGEKLIFILSPASDCYLAGDKFNPYKQYCGAPEGCVFAIIVSVNRNLNDYPDIHGWAENWTWLPADPAVQHAPIDFKSRYDDEIWVKP